MKRIGLAALLALIGLTGAARAASLAVVTDALTYTVGQTVTVTVTGDSQGGTDNAISGTLQYSAALTDTVGSSQSLLLSVLPWIPGILTTSDGSAEVFDQSRGGILPPATVSNQLTSTATLTAMALGTVALSWAPGLDFFGLTSASGTSFTVVSAPEPGTGLLIGLGLAGVALVRRRA
jgi:PEP-CTERM motif-containing protein